MKCTKKFFCVLLALLIVALCGCDGRIRGEVLYSNENYEIIQSGEVCYLQFQKDKYFGGTSGDGMSVKEYPTFRTISEMREGVIKGDFTENELRTLQNDAFKHGGALPVTDLNNLYEITVPSNASIRCYVWYGGYYAAIFSHGNSEQSFIIQDYESHIDLLDEDNKTFERVASRYDFQEIWRGTDTVTGEQALHYSNSAGSWTISLYTIRAGGKTLHIKETWAGPCPYVEENCDEAIYGGHIMKMRIIGEENGEYFWYNLGNMSERPSAEWLMSFGLTPYEETETE